MQPGITKSEQEGMDSPKAYLTPTIAPAGISFYNGTKYPGWKNSLFVTALGGQQLRRIEITKDTVTHQEVVFNEYGRVRDIVIGPDGLFYIALSLPGQRLSDTTAGVIVRDGTGQVVRIFMLKKSAAPIRSWPHVRPS